MVPPLWEGDPAFIQPVDPRVLTSIYNVCPLPDPDVGISVLVCDVENTSIHFRLCGCQFILCLFGECPRPFTIMS